MQSAGCQPIIVLLALPLSDKVCKARDTILRPVSMWTHGLVMQHDETQTIHADTIWLHNLQDTTPEV
jgi:hypothetical protein